MSPKHTRARVAPEISRPVIYPMVVLGFYSTAKAALIKGFGIPEKMAKELIRQSRNGGAISIIVSSAKKPEIVFGAVLFEGRWLAAHGRKFATFETMAEAQRYAEEVKSWGRAKGKTPPRDWVFVLNTDSLPILNIRPTLH